MGDQENADSWIEPAPIPIVRNVYDQTILTLENPAAVRLLKTKSKLPAITNSVSKLEPTNGNLMMDSPRDEAIEYEKNNKIQEAQRAIRSATGWQTVNTEGSKLLNVTQEINGFDVLQGQTAILGTRKSLKPKEIYITTVKNAENK